MDEDYQNSDPEDGRIQITWPAGLGAALVAALILACILGYSGYWFGGL
jgi:hypothetical protein